MPYYLTTLRVTHDIDIVVHDSNSRDVFHETLQVEIDNGNMPEGEIVRNNRRAMVRSTPTRVDSTYAQQVRDNERREAERLEAMRAAAAAHEEAMRQQRANQPTTSTSFGNDF